MSTPEIGLASLYPSNRVVIVGATDKDRTEKGYKYAMLVSLLEPDSELYRPLTIDGVGGV